MIFNRHAVGLYNDYQAALNELEVYRKTAPSLSVAAIPVIAQYGITSLVDQFRTTHTNIKLALEEREPSTIFSALDSHQYDLAFVRDNDMDTSQYSSLEILTDRLMVAVSDKHRFASRTSLCLAELADENFITYKQGTIVHKLVLTACRSAGFEPRIFYATLRGANIIGLVAANSGVALMMEKVLDYYKRPDVISIPLKETIESKIVIAYPRDKKLSKPAKTFIEFMQTYLHSMNNKNL